MPQTDETAGALFRAGRLTPAIEAANAILRHNPADIGGRLLLAELLVFNGDFERADTVLDAAAELDPVVTIGTAEFRQLLRAALARRQHAREGRLPEFLGELSPALRKSLAAQVALRAGDAREAASLAAEAEELRPRVAGRAGDSPFDDFRDVDDLCAGYFEFLTTTGKYFWVPTERVASVEFHPPGRPRDLAWRRATVSVIGGPDGDVYLPALYQTAQTAPSDELRLGRLTDWIEPKEGPVQGIGQRVFLVGDEAVGIMDLTTLRFAP
jgi:type VI secretion system protein ImpE